MKCYLVGVEYEDMFKEITRKLYGDSENGLYPHNTQIAQLAQGRNGKNRLIERNLLIKIIFNLGTPTAPPEGGERSFTTLVSDQRMTLEYDGVLTDPTNNFKPEDHQLSTAFGLAALMQNGFPPPTISFPVTSSTKSNLNTQTWVQQNQQSNR